MNVWELTCIVFPPSPLGSAENDSKMQNSGSVEMCRGHWKRTQESDNYSSQDYPRQTRQTSKDTNY